MKNKNLFLFGVLLLLSVLIVYFLIRNHDPKEKVKLEEKSERVYKTILARKEVCSETILLEGILRPSIKRDISFEVGGLLEAGDKKVSVGSEFQFNQLLYRINIKSSFDVLSALKIQLLKNIQLVLPDIEQKFPSEKKKWKDFSSKIDPSKRLPEFPILNSDEERSFIKNTSIVKDYVKAVRIESEIEKHFYLAPFDGIVTKIYSHPGNMVRSGKRIAEIAKSGSFEVEFEIPDSIMDSFDMNPKNILNDRAGRIIGEGTMVKKRIQKNVNKILFRFRPLDEVKCQFGEVVYMNHLTSQSCFKLPNSAVNGNFVNILTGDQIKQREIKILKKTKDSTYLIGLKEMEEVVLNFQK